MQKLIVNIFTSSRLRCKVFAVVFGLLVIVPLSAQRIFTVETVGIIHINGLSAYEGYFVAFHGQGEDGAEYRAAAALAYSLGIMIPGVVENGEVKLGVWLLVDGIETNLEGDDIVEFDVYGKVGLFDEYELIGFVTAVFVNGVAENVTYEAWE